MLRVNGQSARMLARSYWPAMRDLHRMRFDLHYLARAFKVRINVALTIGDREFRRATEINMTDHFPGFGVDNRRALRITVHRKHALGSRIVHLAIRVGIRRGAPDDLQRLQIEYPNLCSAPISDKTAIKLRREHDSVDRLHAADLAHDFSARGVDDNNVIAMCNEQTMRRWFIFQVIPKRVTGNRKCLQQMVARDPSFFRGWCSRKALCPCWR